MGEATVAAARGRLVERRQTPTCLVQVWRPALGFLVTEVRGYLDLEGARVIDQLIPRVVREDGRLRGYHDWGAMEDYEADARNLLTETTVMNLRGIETAHFLAGSRIVAFGVRAAGAVIGKLVLHPTRASFEGELERALSLARYAGAPDGRRPGDGSSSR